MDRKGTATAKAQPQAVEKDAPPPQKLMSLLRSYAPELFALDANFLPAKTFSFPWKPFSDALSTLFGVEISLSPGEIKWRDNKDFYDGLVAPTLPLAFSLPGVKGSCSLLINRSDVELLMKESLHISLEQLLSEDPAFFDQFWLFASLEACAAAQGLETLRDLSPHLASPSSLDQKAYLSLDIEATIAKQKTLLRLFISPEFLESWKALKPPEKEEPFLKNVTLQVAVEAGRTFLSAKELPSFRSGDILIIDHPFIIPGSDKSRVYLTHRGKPLFRARLKDDGIKILEMPLQHEAFIPLGEMSMANQEPIPEELPPIEEFAPEEQPSEEVPAMAPEEEVEAGEETAPEGEEASEEQAAPEEKAAPEETLEPMTEEEVKEISKKATLVTKKPVKLQDIPLPVVVQLAEMTMTMGELADLQPGNLLNLDIRPEQGVSLVINGRVIATGELILVGENVGVRIQETTLEQ